MPMMHCRIFWGKRLFTFHTFSTVGLVVWTCFCSFIAVVKFVDVCELFFQMYRTFCRFRTTITATDWFRPILLCHFSMTCRVYFNCHLPFTDAITSSLPWNGQCISHGSDKIRQGTLNRFLPFSAETFPVLFHGRWRPWTRPIIKMMK